MTRSHLVFLAKQSIPDRFLLVKMTAKGTRALHGARRDRTIRLQTTINEVLLRIAGAELPSEPPCDPEEEGVL